jgi:hypothetical protein
MIQHTTAPTAVHRVECHAGHPKLISNVTPSQGLTAYCRRCQTPHLVAWESLPSEVLRAIADTIGGILLARTEPESG